MTVGFIIDSNIDFPGGVQQFVKGLAGFLKARGRRVLIFTSGKLGLAEKQGLEVFRLGRAMRLPGSGADVSVYADWPDAGEIKRTLRREKVDILHLQGAFGLLGMSFLDNSALPSVATFHNFLEPEKVPFFVKLFYPILRRYINKVDVKVADSEMARKLVVAIAPGEYQIIPPGIDIVRFRNAPPRRAFPENLIEILYVGRLDERKGLFYLLKALTLIQKERREVALTVIGAGPLRSEAEAFVRENKLENVKFLGFVSDDDLSGYYRGADIFCSPAIFGECFGIVLLEAMAAGLPVVAFDNPGYRQVLVGEGRRFLVENSNTDKLAQALGDLFSDPGLHRKMSVWNLNEVRQYDWSVVGEKYLALYHQLARKS